MFRKLMLSTRTGIPLQQPNNYHSQVDWGSCVIIWDHKGSVRIIRNHLGSFGITRDHLGSFGIIWDYLKSLGIIWDHLGSFGIIWDHLGSYGTIRDHSGSFWLIWFDFGFMSDIVKNYSTWRPVQAMKMHSKCKKS